MTVDKGMITQVAVGGEPAPVDQTGFDRVVDAAHQLVVPGLNDAHIHVAMTGESQYFLDLSRCASIDQLQEALRQHALSHTDLPWLIGINWDQSALGRVCSSLGNIHVLYVEIIAKSPY
jgi:predicted amidohydrolase YtcJ